ncbi:MAG: hypothetical protein QHG99_07690 [Methanomicrobiales archaeon]|nr:hypothetical protein [Methanomicrobiales archaeon]
MTLVNEAVEKLLKTIEGCGCEEGEVVLRRRPDAPRCQFEFGVTIEAVFGGRSGEVVTESPVQARTRISFMKGAHLDEERERTAALAIVNVATSFLCISRKVHACPPECHAPCMSELKDALRGRRIASITEIPGICTESARPYSTGIESADLILVTAGDLLSKDKEKELEELLRTKKVLFLGPSLNGLCCLLNLEHWCPYGR